MYTVTEFKALFTNHDISFLIQCLVFKLLILILVVILFW